MMGWKGEPGLYLLAASEIFERCESTRVAPAESC